MFRFVLTPRWIGLGLLMTLAAVVMVGLGLWQLDRYELRSGINNRIDTASALTPAPLTEVLAAPGPNQVGAAPAADVNWTRVTVTGRYDPSHQIIARARTVSGQLGFEVLTPLVLADGSAVIVDRGWLPPGPSGAGVAPEIPAAPTGEVTVVGRIHAPESRATNPEPFDGTLAVRRIGPEALASAMPYSLYGAYVTLEQQTPAADAAFVPIPPDHENAAMNAGYVVQWWVFALLTVAGFAYLVIREARSPTPAESQPDPTPAHPAR